MISSSILSQLSTNSDHHRQHRLNNNPSHLAKALGTPPSLIGYNRNPSPRSSPLSQENNDPHLTSPLKWNFPMGLGRLSMNHNISNHAGSGCGCYYDQLRHPRNSNLSTAASNQMLPSPPPSSTPWARSPNNSYNCYDAYDEESSSCSGQNCRLQHQYKPTLRFPHDCDETAAARDEETTGMMTASTRSTASPPSHRVSFDLSPPQLLYKGPTELPEVQHMRIYDCRGPISFQSPSVEGGQHARAELRQWPHYEELVISQNSSKRKIHKGVWLSHLYPDVAFPVAVKFVEDNNARDGRSIKREIECHLFIYQRLQEIQESDGYPTLEDAWPSAELLGYHLDKRNPGNCMLVTRKLSGPDFFELIRESHQREGGVRMADEMYKLHCCSVALKRVQQYAKLGIRHNDIKPDNIVIDVYITAENKKAFDVKIIDLGTASMHHAKDFTGGTAWYESPEQKILEYYSKKQRNQEEAKKVEIGLISDVWAAGLSIAEVLVGKRVVDTLKQPNGPGPLDYQGLVEGWAVEPNEWIQIARAALFNGPRRSTKYSFCYDAAKWIFDHLVKPLASERATIQDAINVLSEHSQRAVARSKRTPTTRSLT